MARSRRFFEGIGAAFFAVCLLVACNGSRDGSTLPALSTTAGSGAAKSVHPAAIAAAGSDIVAINAGGGAAGSFSADKDYSASSWTYATTSAISTGGVSNPAPQAVYQGDREGSGFTYTIGGLSPGSAYTVRLSFAELWWKAAGKRTFNVSINGTGVLTKFDIFASAGGADKAIAESFPATANSAGAVVIALNAVTDNAAINAIEIAAGSTSTPTPTSTPTGNPTSTPTPTASSGSGILINAGGGATGNFVADEDYSPTGTSTSSTTSAINTNAVTNPAPQAVYQTQRYGTTISYSIGGLSAGAKYAVRLDFAETYWTAAGKRVFNVAIDGATVLSKFDIFATAGSKNKAVAESFSAVASSSGTITIAFTSVTNYAAINGIELTSGGSATPTPAPTPGFNDYATFGYDNERDGFNPNSTAITPANLGRLHLAWQSSLKDYNTQTQPILATEISGHAGVLFVGGASGNMRAFDAQTGSLLWTTATGQESYQSADCGAGTVEMGIGGTAAYDASSRSLYVMGNKNSKVNAYASNVLYHLDAATGQILGQVDIAPTAAGPTELNFGHTAVTLSGSVAYVGTGTTCDISSWRGRVVAVNVPAMTIANTFFTVWDPNNQRGKGAQPWGGGGIWGWGGVSLDFSGNVLAGVGNADNNPAKQIFAPFTPAPHEYSGYAETLLQLSAGLTTVEASNHPVPQNSYGGNSADLDVQGTPVVFRPTGCSPMVALQGKSGELTVYDENSLSNGYAAQYQLSPSTYEDGYLGLPTYSQASGLLYAPVSSSVSPTLFAPGLVAINPGCGRPSVAWHAAFGSNSSAQGIPRSVPAVSAGGVVFAGSVNGSGGSIWAIDAASGTVLNGGNPLLQTSGNVRMPATIDGQWVFILDNNGNLYGLTADPNFAAITTRAVAADARQRARWKAPAASAP